MSSTSSTLTLTVRTALDKLTTALLNLHPTTSLQQLYQYHPRPLTAITFILGAAAAPYALLLLPRVRADYQAYLALGPGGVPYNFWGYLSQAVLGPFARRDTRAVPSPYSSHLQKADGGGGAGDGALKRYEPFGGTSFLGLSRGTGTGAGEGNPSGTETDDNSGLPPRHGPRPTVPPFVAPQRQTTMTATPQDNPATIPRMQRFLRELVGANPDLLEIRPSGLEGKAGDAVWLKAEEIVGGGSGSVGKVGKAPAYMGIAKGEIAHVHSEGSSHVTLSLVDAEEAVGKGWAERHRLSGVGKVLPWGYIIVYAPRDDGEFEVWKRLIVAGCRFVSGAKEVAVPSSEDTL